MSRSTPGLDGVREKALAAMEQQLNAAISYDPAAQRGIAALAGKVLAVAMTFPEWTFYIIHQPQGLTLANTLDGKADTTLRGSPVALAGLMVNASSQTNFADSGVEVYGDQELLGDIREILSNLDIDWETALAQLVGDVPAHFINRTVRSAMDWSSTAKTRARDVLSGFLKEEIKLLPSADEVNDWAADIRRLRSDTDRLEAKFNRLVKMIEERSHNVEEQKVVEQVVEQKAQ